jgi:hypothetical protein
MIRVDPDLSFPSRSQDKLARKRLILGLRSRSATRDPTNTDLVTDAAMKLVRQGYVLEADVPGVVERALANWDTLTRGTSLAGK